ncbi:bifunctional adenosylcobinamide kinase/adenosylcobinamide-phosphate guanylyltransferase [Frisingicoccus sp.]|uniref:bifunctional adenosylcobinamide kinase/adenosylcobinamide-phosphate guanylyltransferase n=1 Tax=Frisingicoccus sp. TaxID=1918627 RepID=UPI003AB78E82
MILVTGGCRSGKSEYGEKLVEAMGERRLYVATGKVFDDEMAQRVEKHKERRGELWITHEGYLDLEDLDYAGFDGILLDSVTSIVTNLLFDFIGGLTAAEAAGDSDMDFSEDSDIDFAAIDFDEAESFIMEKFQKFTAAVEEKRLPYVMVTDEIGLGVVPETPLGRGFRDILGRVNQYLAAQAERVYFVISGIPVQIKAE